MFKKIISICVLFVGLLTTPAMGATGYIWINGIPLETDILYQNNLIYAPIGFAGERLDYVVSFENDQINIRSEVRRPFIEGDAKFLEVVNQALDLLQQKDTAHYCMICQKTRLISQIDFETLEKNYENAREINPLAFAERDFVYITSSLYEDERRFTPVYIAGVLTHEGAHATEVCVNYFLTSYESERMAYVNQLASLELLDAPSWMIQEVKDAKDGQLKQVK